MKTNKKYTVKYGIDKGLYTATIKSPFGRVIIMPGCKTLKQAKAAAKQEIRIRNGHLMG
jgi:hypothetical protein